MTTTMLDLVTKEIRGKLYGVGRCEVSIGSAPLDAVAVIAGDERRVTTADHAWIWLANRGLDEREARLFVAEGLTEWDKTE